MRRVPDAFCLRCGKTDVEDLGSAVVDRHWYCCLVCKYVWLSSDPTTTDPIADAPILPDLPDKPREPQ